MGCSNSTDAAQPIPGKIHKPPQNSSGDGANNNYFSDVPACGADELPP